MLDTTMIDFMQNELDNSGFNPTKDNLKFGRGNRKLDNIFTISLPAGHSCPFAKDCRSCATLKSTRYTNNKELLKHKPCGFGIQDGPHTQFRCYTTIDEVLKPLVRKARWHNYLLLRYACKKGKKTVVNLIERSLPIIKWNNAPIRLHVAGDFFNQIYFDAWLQVAKNNPRILFYSYTKAIPLWIKRINSIPPNLKLTASYGGTHDWMIERYKLRFVKVVGSVEESNILGLELDHDDSHAYGDGGNFALLIHGQQPAGSIWVKAWMRLKKLKMAGFGKQKAGHIAASRKTIQTR